MTSRVRTSIRLAGLLIVSGLVTKLVLSAPPEADARKAILESARKSIEQGASVQAIPQLKDYLVRYPDDAEAHWLLGTALAVVPVRSDALDELQQATRLAPDSALYQYSLATALARFIEFERAKTAFDKTIALDSRFADAHIGLALILAAQKDFGAAAEHLRLAIQIQGDVPAAAHTHYLLGEVLGQKSEFDAALSEFETAVRLQPKDSAAWFAIGKLKSEQEDHKGAIQAYQTAVKLAPKDAAAHHMLGEEFLKTDELAPAVRELQLAADLEPNNREIVYPLCRALRRSEQTEASKHCWDKLAELAKQQDTPDSPVGASGVLNNEGVQLEKAGQLQAALAKYQEAVKLSPTETVFRRNLAIALCRMGKWTEGIDQLRQVLKQDPNDAIAMQALYVAMDQTAKGSAAGNDRSR